jgi:hypothetical protein
VAESRFLKFTQHLPTALEPRRVSIRSDSITYFYWARTGDLFCTRIGTSGESFEVAESYEEVERMILDAEAKDRMGT